MLTCLMNALADPGFEQRLDAQLNLLPFSNGVMDLESLEFRALRWDDYVSRTVGYSFAPREQVPARDFEAVHAFYEQVLPVAEEREVYLRAAGAALSGDRRGFKHFIVATDKRQGNNGKSTALSSLEHVFGPLAMPSQTNFLYSCTESANSHGANDLAYKGRRVGVFDETSSERAFNLEKIKRVTGGGLKMAVRGANDKTPTEFVWTAVLFIGCNQGNMPRFSASESALMRRMVVIPFRSKLDNAAAEAGEEHAWPMDETTPTKLEQARVAHMHVLLEAYQRFKADGKRLTAPGAPLPLGCLEGRNDVAFSSDPRLEALNGFLTESVNFHLSRGPEQRGKRVLGYRQAASGFPVMGTTVGANRGVRRQPPAWQQGRGAEGLGQRRHGGKGAAAVQRDQRVRSRARVQRVQGLRTCRVGSTRKWQLGVSLVWNS